MKHEQVSGRGVTSPYGTEKENEKELEKKVKEIGAERSESLSLSLPTRR